MFIVFKAKNFGFYVKFNNSLAAQSVLQNLPLDGVISQWGDEIHFKTDISASSDGQTMDVKVGDVAYCPQGKCLCVFFGRTKASTTDKPVPASPVVIIGNTLATPEELREIVEGEFVHVFVMSKSLEYLKNDTSIDDNRKLSQQEIDLLVKQLLAEKEISGK